MAFSGDFGGVRRGPYYLNRSNARGIPSISETLTPTTHPPSRWRRIARLAVLAAVAAAIFAIARTEDAADRLRSAMDWIAAQGAVGVVVFVALYVAATVLALPGSLLTAGAGAVYGLWLGFAVVSLASTLGATAAFLVARYVARAWIARRVAENDRFRRLDEGVAAEGWKLVLLTRLAPFPYNVQNFAYGVTRIPARHYILATWLGMMPGTFMIVYFGHAAGTVATGEARTPVEWTLLALGAAATIAVAIVAARIALRALRQVPEAKTTTES